MAMSQQNSTKAAVSFCDLAAYFSEEEWKLLHDWQKEIYDNVMKEIQQALSSLGPIIAASVFSLKAKEREDVFPPDNPVLENNAEHYNTLPALNCERLLQTEGENTQSFMDRLDNGGESDTHKNSAVSPVEIAAVVSFRIKEESELDSMDHGECAENEHKYNSRGNSKVDARVTVRHGAEDGESSPQSRSSHAVNILHASFGQEDKGVTYVISESNEHIHISTGVNESTTTSEQKEHAANLEAMYIQGDYAQKCDFINQKIIHPFEGKTQESTEHASTFSKAPKIIRRQKTQKPYGSTAHEKCFNDLNLNEHSKMHSGLKQSICSQCGNWFNQSIDIIAQNQLQPQEEQFVCSQCESNFYRPTRLEKDLGKHKGKKLFICNECGRSFKMAQTLTRHQRIHTGERPYTCSDCGKTFRQSDALARHKRIHTGVKPYTCSQCTKSFRQTTHLIRHQQMHMIKNLY